MSEANAPLASAPKADATSLYDAHLESYRAALNRGLDHANRRFGFTLFHSLPGNEAVALRKQMGFVPVEATDHYNLGVVAAEQGEFAEAAGHFSKALHADPDLREASFNLALAFESSGDIKKAKKQWEEYLKRDDVNEEERQALGSHVKELA